MQHEMIVVGTSVYYYPKVTSVLRYSADDPAEHDTMINPRRVFRPVDQGIASLAASHE
jgi:hypothetical protein